MERMRNWGTILHNGRTLDGIDEIRVVLFREFVALKWQLVLEQSELK